MISLYSGTPGSGKSYHAVKRIWDKLRRKDRNTVIANFPLVLPEHLKGRFLYRDNSDICIDFLMAYARVNHRRGVEGQTLVVIDEAQCIFNSRDWNGKGIIASALKKDPDTRMDWIKFFSQHRHLGYNFILIAQSDKMIDKQIRTLIEYDVKHLKMNNGLLFFFPTMFLAIEKWYGQNMKLSSEVIPYRKRIANMYDSYALFDTLAEPAADEGRGEPRSGGSRPSSPPDVAQQVNPAAEVADDDSAVGDRLADFFGSNVDICS